MGAEYLVMDDNARPHRANIIDECLQSEDITQIDWSGYLPDLNPVEPVWDMLGRRIAALQLPPICLPRWHGGGRVRSTTPAEDRYIVLSAERNRRTIAQQVANQFLAASGKPISRKTVARRLRGGGLYARRPVVCVPLTRQHRTARLQWCREHHN
ncbi:transposable element Tcb1 transposase [Trichonephila clavipes]|nr:transposable element Tcb1 transposase [Trichonephila clavipes]